MIFLSLHCRLMFSDCLLYFFKLQVANHTNCRCIFVRIMMYFYHYGWPKPHISKITLGDQVFAGYFPWTMQEICVSMFSHVFYFCWMHASASRLNWTLFSGRLQPLVLIHFDVEVCWKMAQDHSACMKYMGLSSDHIARCLRSYWVSAPRPFELMQDTST